MHPRLSMCFLLGLLVFLPLGLRAQGTLLKQGERSVLPERGLVLQVGGGLSLTNSDLCRGWSCNHLGAAASMGALYKLSSQTGVGATVAYRRLGATESQPEQQLPVSFQAEVLQLSAYFQYSLLDSYAGSGGYRSSQKRLAVPYLTVGVGAISYTATSYPGQDKLNAAQTTYEPAREYPAVAAVVPLGLGLRLRLTDQLSIAPELLYHLTSTDYLDNKAEGTSGFWRGHDQYGVVGLHILYTPAVANPLFSNKAPGR